MRFNGITTVKKTVIIDDNDLVRQGIRAALEPRRDIEVVGEATDAESALELISRTDPHLAIIDLVLGNDDGVALVKKCHSLYPNLRMLVTTVQDEDIYAERVIRGGADGFLSKTDAMINLPEAIDTIFGGDLFISKNSNSRILGQSVSSSAPSPFQQISSLSDREIHVFHSIGSGRSTVEIAEVLNLSPKTIETYREKIKSKLGLKNAEQLRSEAKRWTQSSAAQSNPDVIEA